MTSRVYRYWLPSVILLFNLIPLTATADGETRTAWRIVNYWSVTCAPCRVEIPELNALSEELQSRNIVVLGVNFDEDDWEQTMKLARRMDIRFPTMTQGAVDRLGLDSPSVLPTTYILSPDNQVRATLIGAQTVDSIKSRLQELVGESI